MTEVGDPAARPQVLGGRRAGRRPDRTLPCVNEPELYEPVGEAALGAGTGGVWTWAQARAAGLSEGAIARRVASGHWQLLHRGVCCWGGVRPSVTMRAWAAVLAGGGPGRARAAARTTARLYRLPLVDDEDPATGAADGVHDDVALEGRAVRGTAALHVQSLRLQRGDRVRVDGCPSLALPRALPGLARVLSYEALVCVLDAALHRGLLTVDDLQAVLARHRGERCVPALARAVAAADGRAESALEGLTRLLLRPVLPALVPQVRLRDATGRVHARFDLADEELRLAVEADGRAGHSGERMAARDARRDETGRRLGWHTERVTWFEVRCRPEQTRQRVLLRAQELRAQQAGGRRPL